MKPLTDRFRIPKEVWIRGITIIAILILWESASKLGMVSEFMLPPPSKLFRALISLATVGFPQGVVVTTHMGMTVSRILQGYLLGSLIAIPLGLLVGQLALLERAVNPIVTFARSIATISLLPLAIAWFGIGELSKVLLITYAAFWAVLTNTIQGVKSVDRNLINVGRMYGAGSFKLFFRVILPATLPRIFAGMRIALGLCFMVIIGVEMVGTVQGLGALIQQSRWFYRTDIAIAGTVLIGIFGLIVSLVLDLLERILLPWAVGLDEVER